MILSNNIRKITLTSHLVFSIGWLGAVAVFLALAITGLTTTDINRARSMYSALEICTLYTIVPFCLASFLTGFVQAVGSNWGLFKYYWIIVKFVLTFVITLLLFLHLKPISLLSAAALEPSFAQNGQANAAIDLVKKSAAALLVLISITTISVYKPWGKTNYGLKAITSGQPIHKTSAKSWGKYILIAFICLLILFVIIKHLVDGGIQH